MRAQGRPCCALLLLARLAVCGCDLGRVHQRLFGQQAFMVCLLGHADALDGAVEDNKVRGSKHRLQAETNKKGSPI